MSPDRAWPFLSDSQHPVLSALWAIAVHGALGMLVVAPIVMSSDKRRLLGALAGLGAVLLDLDHTVDAMSLSPRAMEHLAHRPDTHSLLLALSAAVLVGVVTRRALTGWSVFAVIVSHLLFDAAGSGERWLYPLAHPDSIPWLACPIGIALLTFVSWTLARAGRRREPYDLSLPDADPVDKHLRGKMSRGIG